MSNHLKVYIKWVTENAPIIIFVCVFGGLMLLLWSIIFTEVGTGHRGGTDKEMAMIVAYTAEKHATAVVERAAL